MSGNGGWDRWVARPLQHAPQGDDPVNNGRKQLPLCAPGLNRRTIGGREDHGISEAYLTDSAAGS